MGATVRERSAEFEEDTDQELLAQVIANTPSAQRFETKRELRPSEQRKLAEVEKRLLEEARMAGEEFYYGWSVGKDAVEGPSQALAHAAARCWGNCVVDALPIIETADSWVMPARFVDLETGFTLTRNFRQSKRWQVHGKMDGERKDDVRFQIGQSKAVRNVILKALPSWLINKALDLAKQGVRSEIEAAIAKNGGPEKGLAMVVDKALAALVKAGAKEPFIYAKFGVVDRRGIDIDKLVVMKGDLTALQNGQERVDALYPDPAATADDGKKVRRSSLNDQPKAEEQPTGDLAPKEGETVTNGEVQEPPVETTDAVMAAYEQSVEVLKPAIGALLGSLNRHGIETLGDLNALLKDETRLKDVMSNGEANKARKALAEAVST